MHYMNPSWAVSDFDLFDFIGQDDPDTLNGETSQNGDQYAQNNLYDSNSKEQKDDLMFTEMQYNDMAFNQPAVMYGTSDMNMNGCGFLQEDRYPNNGSILNNTINKLHLQQQQNQNQPSTSRLANIVSNQQPSYVGGRMRSQISTQMGQQQPINASDLSENVLLPTSSTSPQNNGYMHPQQTIVKCEPGYEMNGVEYFDSTSDTDSHYSHGGTRIPQSSSSKPRKYRIKPESERIQPQYRQKRAKNNDAVRRSREKSKQAQMEKEKRLQFLEAEHTDYYKQLNLMKTRIKELENELMITRKSCNCGSQQLFRR